jgi:hypothetical protein
MTNQAPGASRRGFPRLAGATLLAEAVPVAARAASPISLTMTALSSYMAEAGGNPLPEAGVEQAKLHILDTVGAIVSGSGPRPGQLAIVFAKNYGGARERRSGAFGRNRRPQRAVPVASRRVDRPGRFRWPGRARP